LAFFFSARLSEAVGGIYDNRTTVWIQRCEDTVCCLGHALRAVVEKG